MIIELSVEETKRLLGATIRTISTDETRTAMNCLCLEASGIALTAVSTDGHRLAKYVLSPLEVPTTDSGVVLLPLSVVVDIQRAIKKMKAGTVTIDTGKDDAETCTIDVRPAGVSFRFPKRSDVTFPPWRQIVPRYKLGRMGRRFIGIDAFYLQDAQAAHHDASGGHAGVTLEFGDDELAPITITGNCSSLTIVIMPMRTDCPATAKDPPKVVVSAAA